VTSFGNVKCFPGLAELLRAGQLLLRPLQQMFAGPVQGVPGRIVFLMANPNSKIVIDPTAGKQVRKRVPRRMFFQKRANLNGLEIAAADTTFVQGTEKSYTAAGIMLPAIFAVEADAHE